MRLVLAALLIVVSGCADPLSCKALNARQSSDAFRTCVSSATEGDDADTITLADGSVLEPTTITYSDGTTIHLKWSLPKTFATFEDGVRLVTSEAGDLEWHRGGETLRRDAVGETAGDVRVHPSGRYAVPLVDGRLLIRSRDGSDPVDFPAEVVWREFGEVDTPGYFRYAVPIHTSFSADGMRLTVFDGEALAAVVDARSGDRLWQAPPDLDVDGLALSSDGHRVAVRMSETAVGVWEVDSGAEVGRWDHPRETSDVAFGPDGSLVVWIDEHSTTSTLRHGSRRPGQGSYTSTDTHTKPAAIVVWRVP